MLALQVAFSNKLTDGVKHGVARYPEFMRQFTRRGNLYAGSDSPRENGVPQLLVELLI